MAAGFFIQLKISKGRKSIPEPILWAKTRNHLVKQEEKMETR
jgi:hypothetical protein